VKKSKNSSLKLPQNVIESLDSAEQTDEIFGLRDELRQRAFQKQYRNDRVAFWHDCFHWPAGQAPKEHQEEALTKFDKYPRVCLRSPRNGGKSAIDSIEILHGYLCYDEIKIPTTASKWLQLEKFLWPEVHKWASRIDWDVVNFREPFRRDEMLVHEIKSVDTQRYAFASAPYDPTSIEGAHAKVIRYLYDEGKSIPAPTWDAPEGAFAGNIAVCELAEWRATSTPGIPAGRFYDIQSRKPGYEDWYVMHWTLAQLLESGMVSEAWVRDRRNQWGEKSPMYRNQVLGEFASAEKGAMIPLEWIEAANERWREWDRAGQPIPDNTVRKIGYDPAGEGNDMNCKATRYTGLGVTEIEYHRDLTEMESCGILKTDYDENGQHETELYVEVGGGYGSGVVSRLREQGVPVTPVKPGASSTTRDISGELQFLNIRAQLTYAVVEWLNPESGYLPILPPDDRLTADLTSLRYMAPTSAGKIRVEAKEVLAKADRLGRSPDGVDALKNTFIPPLPPIAYAVPDKKKQESAISQIADRHGGGRMFR